MWSELLRLLAYKIHSVLMTDSFVHLVTFNLPHEAYLVKALLESNAIEVKLHDEHVSGLGYSQAVGGVKVLVRQPDLEKARAFLDDNAKEE